MNAGDYMYTPQTIVLERHDFGETRIKELEKENNRLKQVAEELVVVAFSISELRDLWRVKFGLPEKCIDNGDMP